MFDDEAYLTHLRAEYGRVSLELATLKRAPRDAPNRQIIEARIILKTKLLAALDRSLSIEEGRLA